MVVSTGEKGELELEISDDPYDCKRLNVTGIPILITLTKVIKAENNNICLDYNDTFYNPGFQIPSCCGLPGTQVDIKGSPHCESIKTKRLFRTKNLFLYSSKSLGFI